MLKCEHNEPLFSSNPKHVEWARSFLKVLNDLFDYIKEYHAIGVFWNREVIAFQKLSYHCKVRTCTNINSLHSCLFRGRSLVNDKRYLNKV